MEQEPKNQQEKGISPEGFENLKEALDRLSSEQLDEVLALGSKIKTEQTTKIEWEDPNISTENLFREWFYGNPPGNYREKITDTRKQKLREQLMERGVRLIVKSESFGSEDDGLVPYIVDSKGNEFQMIGTTLIPAWLARLHNDPSLSSGAGLLDELKRSRSETGNKWYAR